MIDAATPADPAPQVAPEPPPAAPGGGSLILDAGRADRAPPSPAPAPLPPAPAAGTTVAAASAAFTLRALDFEGVGRGRGRLEALQARFVGRRMDAAGLAALADAATRACAGADVALCTVRVPPQSFTGGLVRVQVIESYVERVDVVAQDGRAARQVELYARRLLRERPLRKSSFDRQVGLMNLLPGVDVDVRMEPGPREGALRMVVRVRRRRWRAGVAVGDRGIHLLGRTQAEANLTADGLFRDGDETRFVFLTSLGSDRLRSYGLTHATPLGPDGLVVQGSLGYLQTRPDVGGQRGEAGLASLQASWPAMLRADRNLYLTATLDGIDASNALFGATLTDERVRAVRGAAAYAQSFGTTAAFRVSATLSQGLPVLGSRPSSPGYSDTAFTKLSLQAQATHDYGRWQVRAHATAQVAADRVPFSEQLALGGEDYGRAFPAALVTGDQGAAGSVELAYRLAATALPHALQGSEVYAFADAGRVRLDGRPRGGLPEQTFDLASAGVGVRVPLTDRLRLQAELSHRVVDTAPAAAGGDDWRVVFGTRASY